MLMQFKEMKSGYPAYILHKDSISATIGKVKEVSVPHIPINQQFSFGQGQVVDVTIEEDGVVRTYTIPEGLSVTYANDIVISTDKEGILREVEAISTVADEAIASIDKRKEEKAACVRILEEWSTEYKEKKEADERLSKMEDKIKDVASMVETLIKKLS